jgi:hypothetical protein
MDPQGNNEISRLRASDADRDSAASGKRMPRIEQ